MRAVEEDLGQGTRPVSAETQTPTPTQNWENEMTSATTRKMEGGIWRQRILGQFESMLAMISVFQGCLRRAEKQRLEPIK